MVALRQRGTQLEIYGLALRLRRKAWNSPGCSLLVAMMYAGERYEECSGVSSAGLLCRDAAEHLLGGARDRALTSAMRRDMSYKQTARDCELCKPQPVKDSAQRVAAARRMHGSEKGAEKR